MFLSSEQQEVWLKKNEKKKQANFQVLLLSHFIHALTGEFLPEVHDFFVPSHAVTRGILTLSKGAKNRQQIARKKVRVTISFFHILNVISIPPLDQDQLKVTPELFKIFLLLDGNITWLTVLSIRTFSLTCMPNSGINTLELQCENPFCKEDSKA